MKPLPAAAPEPSRPSMLFISTSVESRTNPWAVGTATVVNGGVLALVLLLGFTTSRHPLATSPSGSPISLTDFSLFAPPSAQLSHGGGGGGSNDLTDPIRGRLPDRSKQPLTPPQVPLLDHPQLAINSAIAVPLDIKLPDNPSLPNIGVHSSPNVSLASNGPGSFSGIGTGSHGGDGPGSGPGWGPGSNGGAGGGPYTPGIGGVSAPIPIVTPEAEFSDEARRAKYQGTCIISLVVDAQGYPQAVRVVQPLGMGLDEKALEAVRKYRFKPALKNGKPVPARMSVAVIFHLY